MVAMVPMVLMVLMVAPSKTMGCYGSSGCRYAIGWSPNQNGQMDGVLLVTPRPSICASWTHKKGGFMGVVASLEREFL